MVEQEKQRTRKRSQTRKRIKKGIRIEAVILLTMVLVLGLLLVFGDRGSESQSALASQPLASKPEETTGHKPTEEETISQTVETTAPYVQEPVRFSAEDMELLNIWQTCYCDMDLEDLLLEPLEWDMMASDFTVLILHTHTTESYSKSAGENYVESYSYRTEDENYNMIAIGKRVAQILREYGVNVIHDTTFFEEPNSDYAYKNAREAMQEALQENPSIQLVIDIHRDAALDEDGNQWGPTITVDGEETARLSFVVGTACGEGGNSHWQENMAYAAKLEAQLDKQFPNLCRQTLVSSYRYNQDLPATYLLAEVGLAGNTLQEALNAAECLAKGILDLAKGSVSE